MILQTGEVSEMKKQKKDRKKTDIFMIIVLFLGISLFSYPFVSDAVNSYFDQQLVQYYQQKANNENEEAVAKLKEKQDKQNAELAKDGNNPGVAVFNDAVSNEQQKKIKKEQSYLKQHTIATLTIPKIKVSLPIFDQTNELFLQNGVSLLEGTSIPSGGPSTHSVLSTHRGLPEAKLFTDLPKLKKTDVFYIDINNERLAYEVDQIKTIEPTDTQDLLIQSGEDIITLMTCTPYMVNTHRLLVRGHRIPYKPEAEKEIKETINHNRNKLFIWIGGIILAVLLSLFIFRKIKKKRTH